jgi:hypothetical protein
MAKMDPDADLEDEIEKSIIVAEKLVGKLMKNALKLRTATMIKETRLMMPFSLIGPGRHFGEQAL